MKDKQMVEKTAKEMPKTAIGYLKNFFSRFPFINRDIEYLKP